MLFGKTKLRSKDSKLHSPHIFLAELLLCFKINSIVTVRGKANMNFSMYCFRFRLRNTISVGFLHHNLTV